MEEARGAYWLELAASADALVRGDVGLATRLLPGRDHRDRPTNDATLLGLEAQVALAKGALPSARSAFDAWRAASVPERRAGASDRLRCVGCIGADALLALGEPELLRDIYQFMIEHPRFRIGYFGECEAADVARGALALHFGDIDAAERHYRDGLEWARRPDVRFGLVEGRCLQGRADVAEARGDHALALEHLDGAAAKFAEYGAKLYLDQVLAKKEFLKA